uniref:ATP synthase F0 subunit 8 n=1 Tax=Platystethus arenarius TaxID=347436 RepID=UPI002A80B9B7|nr:ATP synthase F0 subunit 8 [Platystethus arenarius]WON66111.1 ATP synthase F0 subunit 8 [Platystethus arenarius]
MPQMSPLNWLSLFLMFLFIFMLFNSMNYFNFMYNPILKLKMSANKTINWKW